MQKELLAQGEQLMRICNSCRYCEGFCAVWRAMEYRREFPAGDLNYLANLCHDCSECYYACQYAPPHEWDINPPLTFAKIRTRSYEQYAWPRALASAFRANGMVVALVTALACVLFQFGVVIVQGIAALSTPVPGGNFYQVTSHGALVTVFGLAALFSTRGAGGRPRALLPRHRGEGLRPLQPLQPGRDAQGEPAARVPGRRRLGLLLPGRGKLAGTAHGSTTSPSTGSCSALPRPRSPRSTTMCSAGRRPTATAACR